MHFTNFISDANSDVLFDNSLFDIDNLNLAHLYFEIPNPLANLDKENFLELDDDISLINSIQL